MLDELFPATAALLDVVRLGVQGRAAASCSRSFSAETALTMIMASLDEEESADAKTRREDVLNQLMTLLNTAYTAGKRTEAEEASEVVERPKARISTQQPQQA